MYSAKARTAYSLILVNTQIWLKACTLYRPKA